MLNSRAGHWPAAPDAERQSERTVQEGRILFAIGKRINCLVAPVAAERSQHEQPCMRTRRPIVLAGAVMGSLSISSVATFFLFDALTPVSFGRGPDMQGLALSLLLIAYVASVWAVASCRFGRWVLVLHAVLAVLLLGCTSLLAVVGVGLLATARCGTGAGIGLLGSIAAILLALGLVPAELYCLGRRHVG